MVPTPSLLKDVMAATLLHDDDLEEELHEDAEDDKEPIRYTIKSIPADLRSSALQSVAERESWIIDERMQENVNEYAELLGFSTPQVYYNVGYGHEYAYVEEHGSNSLDLDELTREATTKDVPFRQECSNYAALREGSRARSGEPAPAFLHVAHMVVERKRRCATRL
jgi:hypothetical protein